jgi:BirA family biotin operon repressor/biotin-[acetyl-CoA-carboxylase] ligase
LASTNDRAAELLAAGAVELPLLIVADEQTAGRGRGANRWWTGAGSLAMSLVVAPEHLGLPPQGRFPMVALAAAVAIVETVAPLLPGHRVGLDWPNDVRADARKLAGILIEVLPGGRHVVGIGLNTNNSLADAPPALRETVATLYELTGRTHDQTQILVSLLQQLQREFARLASAAEQIAERANALCLQYRRTLTIQSGSQTIAGVCRGIAPDGALRLDTREGERRLYSGVLKK